MAVALVDLDRTSSGVPSNGLSTISGYVSTATNLIWACGIYQHSSQLATAFSDTGGNTYVQMVDFYDATSSFGIAFFYAANVAGGAVDITFKCGTGGTGTTPNGAKIGNAIAEFSGLHPSAPFSSGEYSTNVQATPTGTANALTSGNMPVLAVQPGIVVGIAFDTATSTPPSEGSVPASTFIQNCWGFGATNRGVMSFRAVASTAATAATFTTALGGSDRHISMAAFLNEPGVILTAPQWFQYQPRLNVLARR